LKYGNQGGNKKRVNVCEVAVRRKLEIRRIVQDCNGLREGDKPFGNLGDTVTNSPKIVDVT
jgi:hypothetical protein